MPKVSIRGNMGAFIFVVIIDQEQNMPGSLGEF